MQSSKNKDKLWSVLKQATEATAAVASIAVWTLVPTSHH